MSSPRGTIPVEEYWDWFTVALFVLVPVDMITTMCAAMVVGPAAEANPLMRWALREGPVTVSMLYLVATVVAVGGFYALMRLLEATPPPNDRIVALSIQVWLGLLIAAGLFVFANNLSVIFHGESLI